MNKLADFPTFDLTGKVALVTGASSGFGHRIALVLARAGAKVAITARRADKLNDLKAQIEAMGGTALPITLDMLDFEKFPACLDKIESELGPLDILVNNAGNITTAPLEDMTPEIYDAMFDTNVRGSFFMARDAGERMLKRPQGGRIINVSSMAARVPFKLSTVYSMTKASILMMTRSLAREWSDVNPNLNINAICPGLFETPLTEPWFAKGAGEESFAAMPRRRLGQPRDLDGLVLLLASEESRFITGADFLIDDGQTLTP